LIETAGRKPVSAVKDDGEDDTFVTRQNKGNSPRRQKPPTTPAFPLGSFRAAKLDAKNGTHIAVSPMLDSGCRRLMSGYRLSGTKAPGLSILGDAL